MVKRCLNTPALICLCLGSSESTGKARISFSLARATCTSAVNFARSNQIQRPSKSPTPNDISCKMLTWNNCGFNRACRKFKLRDCPSKSKQRNRKVKTTRVAGGTDAIPHEFTHVVRIAQNGGHICGGTILNENYVVTAAHCFYNIYDPGNATNPNLVITAGEHNIQVNEGTEQIRNLKSVMWHENYDCYYQFNYTARILLDEPFEFNRNVLPPKLSQLDYEPAGQKAIVMGWGSLSSGVNAFRPDILQKVDMTVLSHARCFEEYNNKTTAGSVIIPEKVCVSSEDGWKSACGGDSVGPLSIKLDSDKGNNDHANYLFIGIASHVAGCETDFLPNVYTRISKYLDWIKTHMLSN